MSCVLTDAQCKAGTAMSTINDEDASADAPSQALTTGGEPFTPAEAQRAAAESLAGAADSTSPFMERQRAGRVEAETRRVSEEVTRQAQERLNAVREQRQAADSSATEERSAVTPSELTSMLIRCILVPLDGTPFAERAVPYARAIAHASGAVVTLAHVCPPRPPHPLGVLNSVVESIAIDAQRSELPDMDAYLRVMGERIATMGTKAAVTTTLIQADSPSRALRQLAKDIDADLVVIASRAHEGLERRILGTVASDIVQHSSTPVLIVPPLVIAPMDVEPSLARILVPLDGSLLAEQALAPALALFGRGDAAADAGMAQLGAARELALLYVADTQAATADGNRYLHAVRDVLLALPLPTDVTVQTECVVGSPPGTIVSGATFGLPHVTGIVHPYDLLVMATHGRGGLSRWLFGSVAEYVLPHSTVPVMLVHSMDTEM
jgi:nucleotide-binding universal stress UspA family protein